MIVGIQCPDLLKQVVQPEQQQVQSDLVSLIYTCNVTMK
jgi:hypothetical protein